MIFSTLFSLLGFEGSSYHTTFSTSIKRFFQYIFSFWYFFFFLYFFSKYDRKINSIIFWGVIYITIFAIIYSFNRDLFIYIKQILCPFDPQINRWLNKELLVFRYNFLWADPNNVAYAATSLVLFYLVEEKKEVIYKYILLVCLSFILLCTMSFGGLGVAFVLVSYIVFFTNSLNNSKTSIILGIIAIIGIILFIYTNLDYFQEIYSTGIERRHSIYGNQGIAGGGGRMADFIHGLKEIQPLFLIVGSGQEGFVTEIGHIYLICMYGLPVYIFFMYIMFGKKRGQKFIQYLTIIPMFVGFTINIAIGEQKYLLIILLISAYYAAIPYKNKFINYENLPLHNNIR